MNQYLNRRMYLQGYKLANKDQSVVQSDLDVNGKTWSVICVSMGSPHLAEMDPCLSIMRCSQHELAPG